MRGAGLASRFFCLVEGLGVEADAVVGGRGLREVAEECVEEVCVEERVEGGCECWVTAERGAGREEEEGVAWDGVVACGDEEYGGAARVERWVGCECLLAGVVEGG